MSKPNRRRSACPVACTLDLLGDRWTLPVIRDLLLGKSRFKEFMASPEGIASNILADRLERLLAHGIVEMVAPPANIGRPAYRLTARGRSLRPVLETVRDWGLAHIKGTEARLEPDATARRH